MGYRIREQWLAGMSREEFAGMCPWQFVMHPESVGQWEAEFAKAFKLRRYSRDELLSLIAAGLYGVVRRQLQKYGDAPPERRAQILIGSCIQYVRTNAVKAAVLFEPGDPQTLSLEGLIELPRTHGLQDEYSLHADSFREALQVAPQYLSEGVVLEDENLQRRHAHVESIRVYLKQREHQVLRLLLIERLESDAIAETLNVCRRQVWRLRRSLITKLMTMQGLEPYRDALTESEFHLVCSALINGLTPQEVSQKHGLTLVEAVEQLSSALKKMEEHSSKLSGRGIAHVEQQAATR